MLQTLMLEFYDNEARPVHFVIKVIEICKPVNTAKFCVYVCFTRNKLSISTLIMFVRVQFITLSGYKVPPF